MGRPYWEWHNCQKNQDCLFSRVWHFGFETSRFRNFSIFFDGIGIGFEKFWYRKKYRYRFRKILVSKKVSVSVSKKIGIEKSIGIGFETFLCFLIVSVSVSKNFGIDKSIGIGFDFFWYRKKYRYRFRKNLV